MSCPRMRVPEVRSPHRPPSASELLHRPGPAPDPAAEAVTTRVLTVSLARRTRNDISRCNKGRRLERHHPAKNNITPLYASAKFT